MGMSLDATDRDKMMNWFSGTLPSGAKMKDKNGAYDATNFLSNTAVFCYRANQHQMYLSIVKKKQQLNSYINAGVLGLSY